MGDRFLLWLGAGAVCAGVTVGMLAGAGTAFAQTESDGDDGAKTSQSAKPAESQPDSDKDDARPKPGRDAVKAINAVKDAVDDAVTRVVKAAGGNDRATAAESTIRTGTRPKPGQRAAAFVNAVVDNMVAAVTQAPDRTVVDREDPRGRPRRIRCVDRDARRQPRRTFLTGRKIARITTGTERSRDAGHADPVEPHPGRADRSATEHRGRRSAAATDRRAAGHQRHRHRDLQPDLVRRGRDRGTSQGPAGQRRHGRAFDPRPGRRPRRARGLVLPRGVRRRPRSASARADHLSAARLPGPGRLLRLHRVLPGQVDEQRRRRPDADVEHLRHRRHVAGRRPDAPRRRRSVQGFQPRTARQRTGRRLRAGTTAAAGRPRRPFARRRPGDRYRALYDG